MYVNFTFLSTIKKGDFDLIFITKAYICQILFMDIDPIHFDDTQVAFASKDNRELRKANFIFSLVNNPFISSVLLVWQKLLLP